MLRIDGKSGKTEWRIDRPNKAIRESPDAYITPALAKVGNSFEIILNGADVVTGHDPATGQELWRADGLNPDNDPAYGKIYITSEDGVASVYRAGPKFELLAENEMDDYTLSSIAVKGGQLFLRTAGWLWVIGPRSGSKTAQ